MWPLSFLGGVPAAGIRVNLPLLKPISNPCRWMPENYRLLLYDIYSLSLATQAAL